MFHHFGFPDEVLPRSNRKFPQILPSRLPHLLGRKLSSYLQDSVVFELVHYFPLQIQLEQFN